MGDIPSRSVRMPGGQGQGGYYDGGVLFACKRIDGRWQVDMSFAHKMKFKATPEALYMSNGGGMEWIS